MRYRRGQADVVAVIAAGGALGGLARWSLTHVLPQQGGFPWATFVANLTGCLVLGAVIVVLTQMRPLDRYARPFVAVGLLGGFTTFATYTSETRDLLLAGRAPLAMTYLFGTLLVCLPATWAGMAVTRRLIRPTRVTT